MPSRKTNDDLRLDILLIISAALATGSAISYWAFVIFSLRVLLRRDHLP